MHRCNDLQTYNEHIMYKIKWIGNLDGSSHKGKAVYSPHRGGVIATITSTDYKHPKLICIQKDY